MRHNKPLGIFGGNDKFLEAIIRNGQPQREMVQTEEEQRETRWQDEQSSVATGSDHDHVETTKRERARQTFKGMYVDRPYVGRKNAKRKGTIRNHVEARAIRRLSK